MTTSHSASDSSAKKTGSRIPGKITSDSAGERIDARVARLQASGLPEPVWLFAVTQVAAALGCAALWLRRRWPAGLAVAEAALGVLTDLAAVALVVALFTVAVNRPPRTTAFVFGFSLHAGALEFHPDAPAEAVARAAKVIRESAHQALQDLREVIGVLRARSANCPSPPWPTCSS